MEGSESSVSPGARPAACTSRRLLCRASLGVRDTYAAPPRAKSRRRDRQRRGIKGPLQRRRGGPSHPRGGARCYRTEACGCRTPASTASGPRDAERHTGGGSARQQQASFGPRHTDGASKQPVAQRNGDEPPPSRAYARRSPVPERTCPTRRRRRAASTNPDAPRRRRSFSWCRTSCTACRPSMTSASRARMARGARS
ncbi:hypothetical protein BH09GEM1_BH09GEM1_45210 [soil metagenome]